MDELKPIDVDDILACAASALSRAAGAPVGLAEVEPISGDQRRNFVARARTNGAGHDGRSVIVKMTRSPRYDPADDEVLKKSGLAREWTATALIAARAPGRGHGAALLAGDRARGLLVFEDLGAGLSSLDHVLLEGSAAQAEGALLRYATALGRLHADTAACADAHHAMSRSIFGAGRPRGRLGWQVEEDADAVVRRIGGAPPADELALLSARLADPGPWQCLAHGDPCPDNVLLVGDDVRLIDYEFARPSHALLDGIYWRIGFPTCWCAGRVPDDVARRIDAAYRAEIARAMRQAGGEETYRSELAYLAAVWLFTCFAWRLGEALKDDARWGVWSVRGRLLWYLEFVIAMTDAADVLPGIRRVAETWLADLCSRWPETAPLGLYPAFSAGSGSQPPVNFEDR